ncbi:hypothetical protein PVK06_012418 [Gossypium arboreum]|uniref:Uncharacterized protein n=1 Tax=Gossypium arboreum TaxID=29729 RepID=A0ABR0QBF6_GOSAR|nr:hypothetical protein PVK06_012418 [Gossypium arboreum]
MWEHVARSQCPKSPHHDIVCHLDVGKLLVMTSQPVGDVAILTSSCRDTSNDKCLKESENASENLWARFYNWITSIENRLYIEWFGVLMIPTLLIATFVFIIAFIATTPVDIDACYMDHEWELSFRLGMRPWITVAYSTPVVVATIVFLIYPTG